MSSGASSVCFGTHEASSGSLARHRIDSSPAAAAAPFCLNERNKE